MHRANYPDNPNNGLYVFLVTVVSVPSMLYAARSYFKVPDTNLARYYSVVYDSLVNEV
jgi:hypothetical protein